MRTITFLKTMLFLGLAVFFTGCAGLEGRLIHPSAGVKDIDSLIDDHENYRIYFAGRSVFLPTALAFDPKEDDLELTFHEFWIPVTSERMLKEIVKWLSVDPYLKPSLFDIVGKDGRLYGHLYGTESSLRITSPAPGTLRLGSMHPTRWDFIWDDL